MQFWANFDNNYLNNIEIYQYIGALYIKTIYFVWYFLQVSPPLHCLTGEKLHKFNYSLFFNSNWNKIYYITGNWLGKTFQTLNAIDL